MPSFGSILDVRYLLLPGSVQTAVTPLEEQLTGPERLHLQQLKRPEDRFHFAAGRALVRAMLSELAPTPPGGWILERTVHGKPILAAHHHLPDLHFNLSHAPGILAAVAAHDRPVGIDAESTALPLDVLEFARACFFSAEVQRLEREPPERRRDLFFSLWTIKEACAKAGGQALRGPLVEAASSLADTPSPTLTPIAAPPGWRLWQAHPSPTHVFTVATTAGGTEPVVCREQQLQLTDLLPGTAGQEQP